MRPSLKQYVYLLAHYLKPQWLKVLLLAALLFSSIGLQLITPQILRYFIDVAKAGNAQNGVQNALTNAALLFLGVVLVSQVIYALAAYFSADVGWTATNLLRADLVMHCLQLDMSFHQTHPPGEMIERLDRDVNALSNFFAQFFVRITGNVLLLGGVLLILFREDWRVGVILSGYVFLSLSVLLRLQGIAVPHFRGFRQINAELSGFWEEVLTATEDIQTTGAKKYIMVRQFQILRVVMQQGRKAVVMFRAFVGTVAAVFVVGNALAFTIGAYLFIAGSITIGAVYLILHYTNLLSRNLSQITDQMNELQQATAGLDRINELYHVPSNIQDGPGVTVNSGPAAIAFEAVSFSYAAQTPVLRDVSFQVAPGRLLGILGRTGSGKTTLTRLLLRFYDPVSGQIRLDKADIRQFRLADLRRHIGMVTQEVQLFHASLRDNLTLFSAHISDEQILQVLQDLGLQAWYRSLPAGLATELAGSSSYLSAGEAQLLAFARVFLKDPKIVILDEASSRLDPVTEQLIEQAMDRLFRGRTGIIIAHRLKTVQCVDEILILENGRVREYGPYKKLAADPTSRLFQMLQVDRADQTGQAGNEGWLP